MFMNTMTTAMGDVFYDKDFNYNQKDHRHPNYVTEKHFHYHLAKDERGYFTHVKDSQGRLLKSPRLFRDMCICKLVTESQILHKTSGHLLPTNVYQLLLTEAMYQREAPAIEWIVSTWPMKMLRVYDFVPLEDYLEDDYLTRSFEENEKMCLVDCFVLGLLKLKEDSNLQHIDFTSFGQDRTLCRELSRLPVLWMSPLERAVEEIHTRISETLDLTKDKTERFLNRISFVYSNIDSEFHHGNKIQPITVQLDLKVKIDDVPIGLSLQHYSPFKFSCSKLWMKHIPEVTLNPSNLHRVLDINKITHFEYEDPILPHDESKWRLLLESIPSLRNLVALSLPNSVDVNINQSMVEDLNLLLKKLKHIRRVDLSYSDLHGCLGVVLDGLRQPLEYLNIKDCRITEDDLYQLVSWRPVAALREVNLSCNNLKFLGQAVISLLEKTPNITCMSVSFCSLSVHCQVLIARACKECSRLKVLCMQGYTPLPQNDILELLHITAQIRSIQKVVLFPESYGFPGNNELEREMNKYHTMRFSYRYLKMRGRQDVELE